ncbi:hypothetical protein OCU04_006788 [Sclerotinia nivalis]|uniref:Uncharacterized protein n=1 Tax=Sclerotinia nivalis TaxID=352851 RepID=A0A9X0AKK2_9HELO|nr:hypothetical protein OCU04_006788 [Sclerotinia nivalis]
MLQLEDNTVYMTLNSRGVPGTFHWGIFITSSAPDGVYYHTTNRSGGWKLEFRPTANITQSLTLVLLYKIGLVSSHTPLKANQVLRAVPANGSASLRTGEAFTCRIWTKDAFVALHENGIVTLPADIDTLERQAFAPARGLKPYIEQNRGGPAIVDSTD